MYKNQYSIHNAGQSEVYELKLTLTVVVYIMINLYECVCMKISDMTYINMYEWNMYALLSQSVLLYNF